MDLIDRINGLSDKIRKLKNTLETEEATKNALIMPFISQILGYDVFDPSEVIPEFTADTGVKKGEKVDYAVMNDGALTILIEAKKAGESLTDKHAAQLYRYFSVTHARIAILTNGIEYQFYTDLEAPNKMDEKPFLVIDLLDFDESMINELKKLSKGSFDIDQIISSAGDLKYTRQIKSHIKSLFESPTDDFVKLMAKQVYSGAVTAKILEQFTDITKRAFKEFINDKISSRLKSALNSSSNDSFTNAVVDQDDQEEKSKDKNLIVTTEEELEGYHLVKALVREAIDPERVCYRDTQSYFGVLIDNNNRKPLCRLHFNSSQKYIGLLDEKNSEQRLPIESINDIYKFSENLLERIKFLTS